jgi:hypothetical protein
LTRYVGKLRIKRQARAFGALLWTDVARGHPLREKRRLENAAL